MKKMIEISIEITVETEEEDSQQKQLSILDDISQSNYSRAFNDDNPWVTEDNDIGYEPEYDFEDDDGI